MLVFDKIFVTEKRYRVENLRWCIYLKIISKVRFILCFTFFTFKWNLKNY